ncbi:MAG: rod shape-determining protein MreD [Armatimonadota bacterium]|nr:rod shape-determining protein MreD [Armatimonadota bacterium]
MGLRLALLAGCLLAGAVIDGAWLSRLPLGAGPDLLLLVVLAVGLRRGFESGAVIGVVAGYVRDLLSGSPLGVFALSYLAVGAMAGAASPMVDLQQRAMPAASALVATLALALISATTVTVTGVVVVSWSLLAADSAIAAAMNAVLAGPVDALVRWIDRVTQRRYSGRVIGHKVLR